MPAARKEGRRAAYQFSTTAALLAPLGVFRLFLHRLVNQNP
jgi:hypothetical protein